MIGAGGWGTAMMISLAGRHKDLVLYCRKPETAEKLNRERENKEYRSSSSGGYPYYQ